MKEKRLRIQVEKVDLFGIKDKMEPEYVYVFKNESFRDNLIKIGRTKNSPSDRAKQLSSATGIPEEFDIVFVCEVCNSQIAEKEIHEILKSYRTKKNREFFLVPIEVAKKFILKICQEINNLNNYSVRNPIFTDIQSINQLDLCLENSEIHLSKFISFGSNKIVPSSVGRSSLSDRQKQRIEIISDIFTDVSPLDINEWCLDFSRDNNPESEIAIWENIAKAFLKVDGVKYLSEQHKKEAYILLLLKSQMSVDAVLQKFKPQMFSKTDAKEILRAYEGKPKPITFRK